MCEMRSTFAAMHYIALTVSEFVGNSVSVGGCRISFLSYYWVILDRLPALVGFGSFSRR